MPKSLADLLFDEWPMPRLFIETDAEGFYRVKLANPAADEYFNLKIGELNGRLLDDMLDSANKDHIINSFGVCFKTGAALSVQVVPIVPGGIRIQSFFLNPLRGKKDGPVIAIDMSGRLPASDHDALRRERDDAMSIFASVFEASDIGILVSDHHGRIVRVNTTLCRTYGWEPIDLIGQEFTIIVPEEQRDYARKRHQDFMDGANVTASRELEILKKDGTRATILASSSIIDLTGARRFRISTIVDITHLKQVERDLRRAKEAADTANITKSSFLANMSHELRTPLNAIIGFSDMMESGTLGFIENENYRGYISDIKFSATHLLAIINDVLDMSKIEAGQMSLDARSADMATILDEVTRLMRARALENEITMELCISEQLKPLKVDARLIRQVMLNLLSNAVKFSHRGGKIAICARTEGQWLAIDVKDEGIGIPADKIEEVMRPFAQVLDPRVAKGQGTGLGLPLARSMIELHGGELTIASKLDKGTTVTCRLPLNL